MFKPEGRVLQGCVVALTALSFMRFFAPQGLFPAVASAPEEGYFHINIPKNIKG